VCAHQPTDDDSNRDSVMSTVTERLSLMAWGRCLLKARDWTYEAPLRCLVETLIWL